MGRQRDRPAEIPFGRARTNPYNEAILMPSVVVILADPLQGSAKYGEPGEQGGVRIPRSERVGMSNRTWHGDKSALQNAFGYPMRWL